MPRGKRRGPTAADLHRKLNQALAVLRDNADEEGWIEETGTEFIYRTLKIHPTEAQQLHDALVRLGLRGREGSRHWVALRGEVTIEDAEALFHNRPTPYEWALGRHSRSERALRELMRQWLVGSVHPGDVWRYTTPDLSFDLEVLELRRPDVAGRRLDTPRDTDLPLPHVRLVLPVPYVPALAAAGEPRIHVMDSIPGALFYVRALLGELTFIRSARSE
jgi:hypothetical protein